MQNYSSETWRYSIAFLDIFGLNAANGDISSSSIFAPYHEVVEKQWSIQAACSPSNLGACANPVSYGGTLDTPKADAPGSSRIQTEITFCEEFFQMPPLDAKVNMMTNNPNAIDLEQLNLADYVENQGGCC